MKTPTLLLVGFCIANCSTFGQGVLIDPSIRNGSFESGVAFPWGGVGVVRDSALASHGEYFGIMQSQVTRAGCYQRVATGAGTGPVFQLTFAARSGTPGFTSVGAFIDVFNVNGTGMSTSKGVASVPVLGSSWNGFEYWFRAPEAWDGVGAVVLNILFNRDSGSSETATAYIDNIVLLQVPEPPVCAFSAVAAALLASRRGRYRTHRNNKSYAVLVVD